MLLVDIFDELNSSTTWTFIISVVLGIIVLSLVLSMAKRRSSIAAFFLFCTILGAFAYLLDQKWFIEIEPENKILNILRSTMSLFALPFAGVHFSIIKFATLFIEDIEVLKVLNESYMIVVPYLVLFVISFFLFKRRRKSRRKGYDEYDD